MITRLEVSSDGRTCKLFNQAGDVLVDTIPSAAQVELGTPSTTFWDTLISEDRYSLQTQVADPGW